MSDRDLVLVTFIVAGVALRLLAAGFEGVSGRGDEVAGPRPRPRRIRPWIDAALRWVPLSGFLVAMATAGGAVIPLWTGLLAAVPIAVLGTLRPLPRHPLTAVIAETVVVAVLLGMWSGEGFGPARMGLALLLTPLAGLGAWAVAGMPWRWTRAAASAAVVSLVVTLVVSLIGPRLWGPAREGLLGLLNLAWVAPAPARRMVLDDRSVAWAIAGRSDDREPRRVVVLFHGANPEGSLQPAAVVLQRAFLEAGFCVLAVDAPGYGASPLPHEPDRVESWHPSVRTSAAVRAAQNWRPASALVLAGHSMGCTDVVFALADGHAAEAAVLLGASWFPAELAEDFWITRFHQDRGLAPGRFADELVREVRRRYSLAVTGSLPPGHAPTTFVAFEHENDDVRQWRTRVFDDLPGRKYWVELPRVDHLGNAIGVRGLVLGEMRALEALERVARSVVALPEG